MTATQPASRPASAEQPQRALSVILAGGGTAGHIEPAMAVADALRRRCPEVTITALGTDRGLEKTLIPERGYDIRLIAPVPLPRKPTADLLRLPVRVAAAVAQTRAIIAAVDAQVIVGFGGYVAVPAYLAAGRGLRRRRRVPVVVHEANAKAGLANKVGARRATRVLAAVAGSGLRGPGGGEPEVVGIPVRAAVAELDRAATRQEAREHFGLPAVGPVLLVFGGSQGAHRLNVGLAQAIAQVTAAGISVLHAHGAKNTADVVGVEPAGIGKYVAVPYLSRMDLAYAAADAVVCRAGAMTVAEVSAVGLPAFYVPLPHGNGEQELNAAPVVAAGGGRLVADADFTGEFVATEVVGLLTDTPRLAEMARAAAAVGHRNAADEVARIVVEVAGR